MGGKWISAVHVIPNTGCDRLRRGSKSHTRDEAIFAEILEEKRRQSVLSHSTLGVHKDIPDSRFSSGSYNIRLSMPICSGPPLTAIWEAGPKGVAFRDELRVCLCQVLPGNNYRTHLQREYLAARAGIGASRKAFTARTYLSRSNYVMTSPVCNLA